MKPGPGHDTVTTKITGSFGNFGGCELNC